MKKPLGDQFWRLWSATGISSFGDGMALVGLPLLALNTTHNTTLIAGVAVASRLPGLLFALPAGAFLDRVNRRVALMVLQLLRLAVIGAFAAAVAAGVQRLAVIYIAAFAWGSLTTAFDCGVAASVPSVVPSDLLVKANARLETVYQTAQEVIGRAVGGIAFTAARALPFVGDAAGYLLSAAFLPGAVPDTQRVAGEASFLGDLWQGLRWFGHNSMMRLLSGVVALLAFCQALVFALLVLYATQDLGLSKSGYGLLLGVSSAGNLVGALVTNRLHTSLGGGWSLVLAGAASAVAYPVMAATHSVILAGAALTVEAVAITIGIVASLSLRQALVPPEMQGRVASAHMTLVLAAFPLGSLAGGLLAGSIGIRTTFLVAGCLQLLVVLATSPQLQSRVRRPQDLGVSNL